MLNRKGIIFTLDAVLAIVAATAIILASFFYLSQTTTNIYKNQDIYTVSLDTLTVLEKDNTIKTAVETSSTTNLQSFLNALPDQLCGNITIYDSSSSSILSAQKTSCAPKNESAIAVRNFIANSNAYYAQMEAWYK